MKSPFQETSTQSKLVKLGEVLTSIEAGKSFKADQRPASSGEWGVLKISALTWGEFQPQENKALLSDSDPSGIPTVHAGDLLISRANTVELVGAVAMADRDYPRLVLSDKTLRLNPNSQNADSRYLLYALRTPEARKHIESHATGTSGSMRNITQANIRNVPISLPPLEEQRRIAAILDKADGVRRKRQEAIRLTEELLRSTFLEMFGDPVINPRRWKKQTLGSLCTIVRGGSPRPISDYLGGTVPWIKIGDATEGDEIYIHKTAEAIKSEGIKKSRYLEPGSLIFANCGVSLGFARILKIGGCIHDGWLAFSDINDSLNQIFLLKLLNSITEYFRTIAPDGTQPNLNTSIMKNFEVPVPPLDLQNKFVSITHNAIETGLRYSEAYRDSENLFNSLLQRAFRGDL